LNAGSGGSDTVTIDTLNPTVAVNIVDASLSDGDPTSKVTFTFSEAPVGFSAADLTVVGGTLPCGRPQRFQGQEIWTFKRPTTPAVSPPDCVALNDFWIDTSTNPAIVKLVIGTTGGVVSLSIHRRPDSYR